MKQVTMFEADDGSKFNTAAECESYEQDIKTMPAKIDWYKEYPSLSVKTIYDAMSDATYQIAMTSHASCISDEWRTLFAVELARMLDEKSAA